MKYLFLLLGAFLLISSTYSLAMYLLDYDALSHYGKGFVWGKILFFILGILLIAIAVRLFRRNN